MSIKELYEWAKKNDVLDVEVEIAYRDEGGYYSGADSLDESSISITCSRVGYGDKSKRVVLL